MWAPVWEWLLYNLPWWVWAILALALWAGLAWVAGLLFGWKYARMMLWPAVGIAAGVAIAIRQRQAGYADRVGHEEQAAKEAETWVDNRRNEVKKLPDDQLDNRFNRWEK